jgi:hypothetical protein
MTSKGLIFAGEDAKKELLRRKKITQMPVAAQIRLLINESQYKFPMTAAVAANNGGKKAKV